MQIHKVINQMQRQLETLAASTIGAQMASMREQNILNGFRYLIQETFQLSFYPECTVVAVDIVDYKRIEVITENKNDGAERAFDLWDFGCLPLQDLVQILQELECVNPTSEDFEDAEYDDREEG